MSPNSTEQALEAMNDEGLFEKLAAAVLRAADPAYLALVHTGVNASGKTIRAPADGILIRTDVAPPHLYSFQHTTTAAKGLRSKWLSDPAPTGTARQRSTEGDVIKTARIVAEARKEMPGLTAQLMLTTNKEPDADTLIAVAAKCSIEGITHQVLSRSMIAHFLDVNPTGQYIRRRFFGTQVERLSDALLQEISVKSLGGAIQRDEASLRIPRGMDEGLQRVSQATFLVARSGFGKSVACHKWLSKHVESGGYGLFLTHEHVAKSTTLTQALDMALRQLHPTLEPDAGTLALSIVSSATPLHIVVEDVNQSGQSVFLAEKIAGWIKRPGSSAKDDLLPIRLICPIWPEVWFSLDRRTRETASANAIYGDAFSALEGRAAVQRRAELAGRSISDITADALSFDLGHDPLLIGLHDPTRSSASADVIINFIEDALQKTAQHQRDHVAADYRSATRALAAQMLKRRALKPRWEDLRSWQEVTEDNLTCLSHLVKDGHLIQLIGPSDQQHISFRHDRVRDQLLIDAAAQLTVSTALADDILQDPHFADVFGGVLAQRPDDTALYDRIIQHNPLALFYAYRKACRVFPDRTVGFGAAITSWLSNEGPLATHNQYIRWEGLKVLANTENAAVIGMTQQLGMGDSWLGWQARFRNGDVIAGITLCLNSRPATIDPSRDAQIAHAKHKFGTKLISAVDQLLRQDTAETALRIGALRMAGHLAEPSFAEAIRTCWSTDSARLEHASDYLWAAARCYGSESDNPLQLVLDVWPEVPSSDQRADYDLRSAFGRHVPTAALRYLSERGHEERLRWPISLMLMEVDDPTAIEFVAEEMASQLRQVERTGGITLYFDHAAQYWERRQEDDNVAMSPASRDFLFNLWNTNGASLHLRKAAFRLWASNEAPSDLEILQQDSMPSMLADSILRERLLRHDASALSLLRPKLEESNQHWWWYARYIWSDDMAGILDAELAKSATAIPIENVDSSYDHLSYLLTRMSPAAAEALLEKHWQSLQGSSQFIQTALLIGTAKLRSLVKETVDAHPKPSTLFRSFHAQSDTFLNGARIISRESQIEALAPYFSYFEELNLLRLGQICNALGFTDVRVRLVDPALRVAKGSGLTYVDEAETFVAFDEMSKSDRLRWVDRQLEDFLETGATRETILALLKKWFADRRSLDALKLVCSILAQIGQRHDLQLLEVVKELAGPAAEALRQDTRYAVMRRSLI